MPATSREALIRRRIAAAGALGAVALAAGLAVGAGGEDEQPAGDGRPDASAPAELPRGGRRILPDFRVVAFYGAPQDTELGALGIGTPAQAARRLERVARPYARLGRPVLPAFELITVIADAHPGDDGSYSTRLDDAVVARYLRAARRARALLILDVQPGHAQFFDEVRALERWLREPDVSLALDPEWHTPGAKPGSVIGSVDAREVNAVSFWLDRLVRERDLPQKLLLVHRFTEDMIRGPLKTRRHVAVTVNVDGFGGRAIKRVKYEDFASGADRIHDGFKLFFREDTNLMRPRHVARLKPRPDVVVYE
jgi:hypothetical protein